MERKEIFTGGKNSKTLKFFLGVIFAATVFFFAPYGIFAATLYLSPASGSYTAGQTFSVSLYVSSPDRAENATQGILNFPADKLEVISLSKTNSVITLWVQEPVYSNSYGTVQFAGVVPNPGFVGSAGKVLTITFKVIGSGGAELTITKGSVLANDGNGTQILTDANGATYKLFPEVNETANRESTVPVEASGVPFAPKISSPTHSDPGRWYNNTDPKFIWELSNDIISDRIMYDRFPSAQPTVVYNPPISEKNLQNIDDGIWYFHAQLRNNNGWGSISNYRFQIDTMSPEPFVVKFINGNESDSPKPQVLFATTDATSGIDYYRLRIGDGEPFDVPAASLNENSYALPVQAPGKKTLLVQAFDKAGNATAAAAEFNILAIAYPIITDYPRELNDGDTLIVKGITYPNATVRFYLRKDDNTEVKSQDVKSDKNGNFVVVWQNKLSSEIYKFWADVTDERGAKSNPTDIYVFTAKQSGLLRFGSYIISYLSIAVFLIILLAVLMIAIWELWKRFQKRARKETYEAEKVLHAAFDKLRENMTSHVKILEKIKSERPLTREENRLMNAIRKDLDVAEKVIAKEIQDVERRVG